MRGLGQKKVVLGGMSSPPWAMSMIWAHRGRTQQDTGLGGAAVDGGEDVLDAVLIGQLVVGDRP